MLGFLTTLLQCTCAPNKIIYLKLGRELEPKMDGILLSKLYCVRCNSVLDILLHDLIRTLSLVWGITLPISLIHTKMNMAKINTWPLLSLALDDLMPNILEWG